MAEWRETGTKNMGEEIQNFRFVERERGKKQQFSIYSELSQRKKKVSSEDVGTDSYEETFYLLFF